MNQQSPFLGAAGTRTSWEKGDPNEVRNEEGCWVEPHGALPWGFFGTSDKLEPTIFPLHPTPCQGRDQKLDQASRRVYALAAESSPVVPTASGFRVSQTLSSLLWSTSLMVIPGRKSRLNSTRSPGNGCFFADLRTKDRILKIHPLGFPGGSVVKKPPVDAGDTGSIPGPGASHLPWSNKAHAPQLLSLCSRAWELQL